MGWRNEFHVAINAALELPFAGAQAAVLARNVRSGWA